MAIVLNDPNESRDRRIKMLLDTAMAGMQIQNQKREIDLKERELDPRVQAGKMASLLAMMGNTEGAAKMFEYSKGGELPAIGASLPSQQQQTMVPDYLSRESLGVNSGNVGLPSRGPMGLTGGSVKVGGATMKIGQPSMNDYDKANLDIQKTLTTEGLKTQQQTAVGAEKTLSGTDRYLQQFERSYNELKKFDPDIDKVGLMGKVSRVGGKIANSLDNLPETAALQAMAKPLAQQIATDIEGRATDEDRKIQADAFADVLKKPTAANARIASNSLLMLKDKGADISKVVKKLSKSNVDVMQAIVKQVYEGAPELKPQEVNVDELFKDL